MAEPTAQCMRVTGRPTLEAVSAGWDRRGSHAHTFHRNGEGAMNSTTSMPFGVDHRGGIAGRLRHGPHPARTRRRYSRRRHRRCGGCARSTPEWI